MKPTTHGRRLSYYQFGATAVYACQVDPRFSYCVYVPESYDEDAPGDYELVVAVHGTARDATRLRNEFIDFAEREQVVIVAPLFPGGIGSPGELHDYKYLASEAARYDLVLLAMVDEVSRIWQLDGSRFYLTGFSGGGHFTHRFTLVHPDRLYAASVAAPGVVTLCDPGLAWPKGVGGLQAEFDVAFDGEAVARVPMHFVVGEEDTDTWEIAVPVDSDAYLPGVNAAGVTRVERIRALADSFAAAGATTELDLVPGVAHEGYQLLRPTMRFFRDQLRTRRERAHA